MMRGRVASALTALLVGVSALAVPQALAQFETYIPAGSTWLYLDEGTDQGVGWQVLDFPDGGWSSGPGQLGYGDGDEATVVSYGTNSQDKHITTYFRHLFNVADPGSVIGLRLRVPRDDGIVVHLNATEVFRDNMPTQTIDYDTRASTAIGGSAEDVWHVTSLDPADLEIGDNILAVEIHQAGPTSSDISFDLELIETDGQPLITRGPYLQQATPTGITVRWRTDIATGSRVLWGAAPGSLINEITAAGAVTEHVLTIDTLQPAATYYYAIGTPTAVLAGDDVDHVFQTPPLPGATPPTRIWVLGDSGTADANAAAVRDAYVNFTTGIATDVWLMLGDNAYNSGTDSEYQAAVFDMYPAFLRTTALWPTLGNHDAVSADSPTESGVYYDIFTLPDDAEAGGMVSGTEAYYSFDYGNIHFICLDSHDSNRAPPGPMLTWLAADLGETLADWIIAFWHHPPYTKGSHDSDDGGDSGGRMRDMRISVLPILEAGGVDLVLCGHSHSYERSFLLDGHYGNSGTLTPAMLIDDGNGRPAGDGAYFKPTGGGGPHEGAVYVVAGSSGKISGGSLNHSAMYIAFNELGSLVLDVNHLRLDATFLNDSGVTRDTFTIQKGCGRAADITRNAMVDIDDLFALLLLWGPCAPGSCPPSCEGDLNADCVIDVDDVFAVLGEWGPCP